MHAEPARRAMTGARVTPVSTPDDVAFGVFVFLWATGLLFQYLQFFSLWGDPAQEYAMAATIGAGLFAVLRPTSVPRFLILCACALVTFAVATPHLNNHEVIIGVLSVTFLAASALAGWRDGWSGKPTRGALLAAYRTSTCWSVLVLYFWAVVHKLNTGFLDPELSCATMQLFNLQTRTVFGVPLSFVPTDGWVRELAIYGTLAIEAAIPILLAAARIRIAGVTLAAFFHFTLGFGYPAFSAFLFSLLSIFLPSSFWSAALGWWRAAPDARLARAMPWWAVARALDFLLGAVAVYALATGFAGLVPSRWAWSMRYGCWLVYGVAVLLLFARLALRARREAPVRESVFAPAHPLLLAAPLVLFLNGLAPHIGLKATQSFAMFSNLRTEGGTSNHLFIPTSWQVFAFERDVVTIEDASDPLLDRLSRPGWVGHDSTPLLGTYILGANRLRARFPQPPTWRLPYVSLKQRLRALAEEGAHDVSVVYVRDGHRYAVSGAETNADLTRVPYWQRKLFRLRAVPSIEAGVCMW